MGQMNLASFLPSMLQPATFCDGRFSSIVVIWVQNNETRFLPLPCTIWCAGAQIPPPPTVTHVSCR
jgi:hypothetical protein